MVATIFLGIRMKALMPTQMYEYQSRQKKKNLNYIYYVEVRVEDVDGDDFVADKETDSDVNDKDETRHKMKDTARNMAE